ncbi:MAG: heme NO-binding domain-containing protein [Planktomarina sp.]
MHALIVKGLKGYFTHIHGAKIWATIAKSEGYAPDDFELTIVEDRQLANRFVVKGAQLLDRTDDDLLQDFGLYLITHPSTNALRRLMRFSGPDFMEFLVSLPDLAPRVSLAVPDLILPRVDVAEIELGFEVAIRDTIDGFDHVLVGVIRGMADDYGALVDITQTDCKANRDLPDYSYWSVLVLDVAFHKGREFGLLGDTA